VQGICLHKIPPHDMGYPDMALNLDASVTPAERTCGERVKQGALSNLTNVAGINGAGDETNVAVSNDGTRLYYLSGGVLTTATLTNARTAGTPEAVTVTGIDSVFGLAFASDGSLYVAGKLAAANQIFKMHLDSPTQATLVDSHLPSGLCAITGLSFIDGDVTSDLYVAYPLAGCADPRGGYVAQGVIDQQIGTFTAAVPVGGYSAPFVITGGLTMLLASPGTGARLFYAERPDAESLWTGPASLPLTSVGGPGTRDVQAAVSPDCKTLYLSSERKGGKGGLDIWAADIAPE
jgi:hypothetical protein